MHSTPAFSSPKQATIWRILRNRLIAVTDARGHRLIEGEDGRKTQLNYAPFLRVTQEIDGLGNRTDLNLESLKVQHTLNLVNTYGKEQELTRRSRTETVSGTSNSKTETFAYDDELRLTKAETQGILWNDQETFTLDGVGNRIPWKYDENNRLIQIGEGSCGSANTICYEYDASGNRIKKMAENRQTHYRYDAQNRLVEVAQTTNGNEQLIARYAYDLFNRRIWKEQYGDRNGQALPQAERTYYLYSDEGLIAEETQEIKLNADGSVTATSQPRITTQYGPRPESEFTTGILFVKTKNTNGEDTIAYYHHDHLQTPIQATDKQGDVVWSAFYNAFGRVTITTPSPAPDKPTITSNLRLPGQYEDEETGLYYNWNRYYSPEEGQYVTQDPIESNVFSCRQLHRSMCGKIKGRSYFCFSAKQKGEWNIFFLMWMVFFVAIISLIMSCFGKKYSFEEIFFTFIMSLLLILNLLSILMDVSVRLFRFFFGRKSKHKDDNLS